MIFYRKLLFERGFIMKYTSVSAALEALRAVESKLSAYHHAMGVLFLDAATAAPKGSAQGRGQTMAMLSETVYALNANPENEALLSYLEAHLQELDPVDRRKVELFRKSYNQISKIPPQEYIEYDVLLNDAQAVWEQAKNTDDFALFAPYLEKIVGFNQKFAGYYNPSLPPYDALLNEYEEGLTVETLDRFFAQLREVLVPLLTKVTAAEPIDDSFLHQLYPMEQQHQLSDYIMSVLGIDRNYCAIAESEHPFTSGFHNKDVRITTHYYEQEHGNQFSNYENYAILKGMDRTTLTDFFEEVETTEEYNGYFCSIAEAISIVVLGSLCGFKNVSQIHQWAESAHAREFLKEKFGIKHVPCYYWLLVLLKMVKPDTLNTCLMKWAAQYLPADRSQTTISLDGKTIRSTTGMKNIESPMHIISAQICEFGVTLASETVDEKSNEIPAVQELLKKLDIEGCLVVADALNCQKETAESIVSGKGDYLLAAKGNQPSLEQEISDYVQDETLRKGMDSAVKKEKNRDRIETRTAYTVSDISWLFGKEKWKNLACIGAIRTEVEKNGEKTDEWHYYISSRKLSAEELLHHARMEWTVETMHWILDVHYGEDFCRIENKTIQQNLNMLRKFTISLIKQHKNRTGSKRAMSKIMLDCLLDYNHLCDVLEN